MIIPYPMEKKVPKKRKGLSRGTAANTIGISQNISKFV